MLLQSFKVLKLIKLQILKVSYNFINYLVGMTSDCVLYIDELASKRPLKLICVTWCGETWHHMSLLHHFQAYDVSYFIQLYYTNNSNLLSMFYFHLS